MSIGENPQVELAATEAALDQLEKFKLAGSVAHDFNNFLQVIGGNLDLAMRLIARQPMTDERIREQLSAAIARAQRSVAAFAAAIQRTVDAGAEDANRSGV